MSLRMPTSRTIQGALGMAFLQIFLAACSTATPGGSSLTGATPLASVLGSPATSAAPAGGLSGAPLRLTRGSAHVALTGGASQAFDLTLSSGILVPDTNVILVWSGSPEGESRDDGLRIQAPSKPGVYQSSGSDFGAPQISVDTGRIGTAGSPPQFAPTGDECTVTLTRADASGAAGSLRCIGLSSTGYDKPVDVDTTFTATP